MSPTVSHWMICTREWRLDGVCYEVGEHVEVAGVDFIGQNVTLGDTRLHSPYVSLIALLSYCAIE